MRSWHCSSRKSGRRSLASFLRWSQRGKKVGEQNDQNEISPRVPPAPWERPRPDGLALQCSFRYPRNHERQLIDFCCFHASPGGPRATVSRRTAGGFRITTTTISTATFQRPATIRRVPRSEHRGVHRSSPLARSTHRLVLQVRIVPLVPQAVGLDGEHRPHPHYLAICVHLPPFVVQPFGAKSRKKKKHEAGWAGSRTNRSFQGVRMG